MGMRHVARLLGVTADTVQRWATAGVPSKPQALARIWTLLEPYREPLDGLRVLDTQIAGYEASCEGLRAAQESDVHAAYLEWRNRHASTYDARAWRESRSVRPARRGAATVDYTSMLDRIAAEHGEDVSTWMDGIDRAGERAESLRDARQRLTEARQARQEQRDALRSRGPLTGDATPGAGWQPVEDREPVADDDF